MQESPIRIKPGSKATAIRIAKALKVQHVQVVEWAVDALGAYFDAHNGRLLLPLDFRQRFTLHQEPLILMEPPPAESKSIREAARGKTSTARRASGARV